MVTFARDFFAVLWACRVSVLSVLAGFALFAGTVQARDVLLEMRYDPLWNDVHWALFFILVFVAWALPVHYAARLILDGDDWLRTSEFIQKNEIEQLKRRRRWLCAWMPRLLGLACFVAVGTGIRLALPDLPEALVPEVPVFREHLVDLMVGTVVAGAAFLAFVMLRRQVLLPWMRALGAALGLPTVASGRVGQFLADNVGRFYLAGVAVGLLVVVVAAPVNAAVPRALLLPIILGGWVPALAALAAATHHYRVPAITIAAVAVVAIGAWVPGRYLIPVTDRPEAARPIALEAAVAAWARANGCPLDARGHVAAGAACPEPVIVIGSGGASRAAYYTAGAVGALLDATCADAGEVDCARYPTLANRIFALSTVSGSSLAAVTIAAALRQSAANGPDGDFPCDKAPDPSGLWREPEAPGNWRDCLQALTAGDYLSPAMLGLVFRDPAGVLIQVGAAVRLIDEKDAVDRGGLLEAAWTSRYDELVRPDDGGLAMRFSEAAPDVAAPAEGAAPPPWRPLLVLNGTSAATGRRIITSHLAPKTGAGEILFADAYDFFELYDRCRPAAGVAVERRPVDVSLTAAALNSARFPLVSPDGAIVVGGNVCDRVLDGGYFENYGAITALEIIAQLSARGLKPFVLAVSNDPQAPPGDGLDDLDRRRPLPDIDDEQWLPSIRVPLQGAMATRNAVGSFGLSRLRAALPADGAASPAATATIALVAGSSDAPAALGDAAAAVPASAGAIACPPPAGGRPRIAEISVIGEIGGDEEMQKVKDLSMSWWLSRLVQRALDRSLRTPANLCQLMFVCDTLGPAEAGSCRARLADQLLVATKD